MPSKNWFIHPPHGKWLENNESFIEWHALHGRDYLEIMKVVPYSRPIGGWEVETKELVKLATKIAVGKAHE